MKNILISIQPKWIAKILNGEKTIEVRKRFPKDYRGWVYIYCTKRPGKLLGRDYSTKTLSEDNSVAFYKSQILNGYVVARFYCDETQECKINTNNEPDEEDKKLLQMCCLSIEELANYSKGKNVFLVHISQLEIFNKPKELSEFFHNFKHKYCERKFSVNGIVYNIQYDALSQPTKSGYEFVYRLTKAPQSWQFIEVEE